MDLWHRVSSTQGFRIGNPYPINLVEEEDTPLISSGKGLTIRQIEASGFPWKDFN